MQITFHQDAGRQAGFQRKKDMLDVQMKLSMKDVLDV